MEFEQRTSQVMNRHLGVGVGWEECFRQLKINYKGHSLVCLKKRNKTNVLIKKRKSGQAGESGKGIH